MASNEETKPQPQSLSITESQRARAPLSQTLYRNLFVTIAVGGVVGSLGYGLKSMVAGKSRAQSSSMVGRITFQGIAVACLAGYYFMNK